MLCMPYTSWMPKRSIMPSLTISRPPPPPSSAGWKITTAVPEKLRVSARYFAAPSSIAVWPSWPQACILPGLVERYGRLVSSSIGSASMSARSPITLLPLAPLPRMTPTTPVLPIPVTTSSQPNALSFSATLPAVRWTSNRISGCAWMSRRHAATSACMPAIRSGIDMESSVSAARSNGAAAGGAVTTSSAPCRSTWASVWRLP